MKIFGYTIVKTKKYESILDKLAEITFKYKQLHDLHHKKKQYRGANGRFIKVREPKP